VDSSQALLVIDMLNPYDHEDAEQLTENVAPIVPTLAELVAEAKDSDVELVYVNDNYGDFTATRDDLVRGALDGRRPDLVEPIMPPDSVAFLQKARHSAFYSTALDHLLRERGINTLVLTGQVTEQCILYTALDAYIRHFDIRVVRDGVAHIDRELGDAALRMMQSNMSVELLDAEACLR
jgi:nicotinamidase-related amidase